MKILHIITGLSTGGAERSLHNLLDGGLKDAGDTAVLSLTDEGAFGPLLRAIGVPVYTLNMARGVPTLLDMKHLGKLVRDLNPDLVQGWMYHGNLAATLAGWLAARRPAVLWNVRQSLYSLSAEKRLTRYVIRANSYLSCQADSIIYNSELSQRQHESFGFNSRSSRVIANGFDTQRLQPDRNTRGAMRALLGIDADSLVVGHVARFHPMKDHAGFLRAAVTLLQKRSDVVFLLVGRGVGLDNSLLSGIVPPELQARFYFVGERSDVIDVMCAMDCFCVSSGWGEGFPNVLAEAMCLEIPCVTTDVGDSDQVIGETGWLVPPRDPEALADALNKSLSLTEAQRMARGRQARERISVHYSLSAAVGSYLSLYEQIGGKRR